jgi:flagellar biosynthetic protein FliO
MTPHRLLPGRRGGRWWLLIAAASPALAAAAEAGRDVPDLGTAVLKMLAALALVLGLFAVGIYLLKRFGVVPWTTQAADLRIERVLSLGYRSRIAVVRASGQRFLVGITPTQISRIAELPEADDEASDHDAGSR